MKVIFMGTPDFAVPTLRALYAAGHRIPLVATRPDKPAGRSRKPKAPPVKQAARDMGLEVVQPERISEPGIVERLRKLAPDAIVVVAFGEIIKKEVLDIPRLGCVNAHASLLPRYRGAAPIQWAIARGERETGVTAMMMDQGMDTGPILLQRKVEISPQDTGGSLHDRLAPMAAELVVETLHGLESGKVRPLPQDGSRATYAPQLKKEDGRIDWGMASGDIALRVRAFDPWPGTFTGIKGKQLRITKASSRACQENLPPGTVIKCGKEGIEVSCGKGSLLVTEVQPAGKRRMHASEWLAGHCLQPGTRLGRAH